MKTTKDIRNDLDSIDATASVPRRTDDDNAVMYVSIPDEDIGRFWGLVRRTDLDPVATKRLGDELVARFDAEPSLGDLFL